MTKMEHKVLVVVEGVDGNGWLFLAYTPSEQIKIKEGNIF